MKRLDLGMIGIALITLLMATGCNNDRSTVELGEPLVVTEQVTLKCDTPFSFKVIGSFQDTNVSTEYNETKESYIGEFGVDISYTVVTPCIPCEENNATTTVIDPTKPIDGNCDCGYELNDCGTLCVESQGIKCGEGTEYNTTSKSCELIPPLECGIGLIEAEGICVAKVYKLEEDDCEDGYTEGDKGYFCFLENESEGPTPK